MERLASYDWFVINNGYVDNFVIVFFFQGFKHTGAIENVNSLNNKYMPKREVFSHAWALTRTALTAIGKLLDNDRS